MFIFKILAMIALHFLIHINQIVLNLIPAKLLASITSCNNDLFLCQVKSILIPSKDILFS